MIVNVSTQDKLRFTGKIQAVTKVKNAEGNAVKFTTDSGAYVEVQGSTDEIFKALCKLIDLGVKVKLTIEKG